MIEKSTLPIVQE